MNTDPRTHPLNLSMFSHTQASSCLTRNNMFEPHLFLASLLQNTIDVLAAINKRRPERRGDFQRRQSKFTTELPESAVRRQDEQRVDKRRDQGASHEGEVRVVVDAEAVLGRVVRGADVVVDQVAVDGHGSIKREVGHEREHDLVDAFQHTRDAEYGEALERVDLSVPATA